MLSFIESQFPVSRLSKESYKERKSNYSQTLTGLGKWWGRKPLILCRATILGLLLPVSDDPERDREVFLKILTMDDEGLLRRWSKRYTVAELGILASKAEQQEWARLDGAVESGKKEVQRLREVNRGISRAEKDAKEKVSEEIRVAVANVDDASRALKKFIDELQVAVFKRQPYELQIARCDRPEQIDGPSESAWKEINAHLGTKATNLAELVRELGQSRFGHVPRVGDAFCGGGSIPFEAARIGCDAYGSDLNPVAALLTWSALNIVGGGEEVAEQVREAQREIYDAVDRRVAAWGIEHRTEDVSAVRWEELVKFLKDGKITTEEIHHEVPRADAYLYCVEVTCPETGWQVPLAPSWVIGEKTKCVAKLVPDYEAKRYHIRIESGVSDGEMTAAKEGTIKSGQVVHPVLREMGKEPASIDQIRLAGKGRDPNARYHSNGLRLWENDDIVPRSDDVIKERLYCVRWVRCFQRTNSQGELIWDTEKEYRTPTEHDLRRERASLDLLRERFAEWQAQGFIPAMNIEPGYNTDQPIRERGWTHWHHLFNPRQLLTLGSFVSESISPNRHRAEAVLSLLGVMKSADNNSKLSGWSPLSGKELVDHVFANQALNTLNNHGARAIIHLRSCYALTPKVAEIVGGARVETSDCRTLHSSCDFWVTDPPYADAVNYHELGDFFMCWIAGAIRREFPDWHETGRRALAVAGSDDNFRRSMVDCYRNLAKHMPDDGMQVVMFTHQDAAVWADLALILWAAGLRVTAAWCIATETDSALKEGNYVQGTVLLILRKQTGSDTAFLDEVYPKVEDEVKRQLDALHDLDEAHATSPDFSDTDYQLAAYAAALRVLTQYASIEDIDVDRELSRQRTPNTRSELEKLIDEAVRIACDHLVPAGFDSFVWKTLRPVERFYLKGLDLESHAEYRAGAYQELARGFGLRDYKELLGSDRANQVTLKTATEFGRKLLRGGDDPFAETVTRQVLFAVREVAASDEGSAEPGLLWLREEVPDFWANRKAVLEILRYLARLEHTVPNWESDAKAAHILAGAVENMHG
jgi:adenine-specific DNA methylase